MTARHRITALVGAAVLCATLGSAQRPGPALRIVTLGGAITETVFALGRGAQVVGVDASSQFPATVSRLPNVGYFRQAGAEGIMALRPTLAVMRNRFGAGHGGAASQRGRSAGAMPAGDTRRWPWSASSESDACSTCADCRSLGQRGPRPASGRARRGGQAGRASSGALHLRTRHGDAVRGRSCDGR
ncbi:MAG: ABC transporter substrate-binding protein [Gemmatimonadaceae bacterium]|nr:ABC transporter substrate-binding protein [Gemmatimonadaceae bacterium]